MFVEDHGDTFRLDLILENEAVVEGRSFPPATPFTLTIDAPHPSWYGMCTATLDRWADNGERLDVELDYDSEVRNPKLRLTNGSTDIVFDLGQAAGL
ncbi:MAG TPA: hypothetical protein VE990_10555 [Acidimicrobiales bacterium]|nr:hypothetical protein [Acidimicrobiales bacterium]